MLKSGQLIEKIIQNLNIFREELRSSARLGLLNQNVHSENFIGKILNIIFDLNLQSLNDKKSNFPGLDLGDEENKGIAFQITSERNSNKINETLLTCIKEKYYLRFKTIKIFILSNKQKSYSIKQNIFPHFSFNPQNDILDFDSLFLEIKNLSILKLKQIDTLILEEIPSILSRVQKKDTDLDDFPELRLDLSHNFRIDLTDEEIEVYLMEVFYLLGKNENTFQNIKINQEYFFESRLRDLKKQNKSVTQKKEIVEINLILNEFNKLKNELELKVKMLYHTDKYPISKSFSKLAICIKEIIEKLSFPFFLIEETTYNNYFNLNRPIKAEKFNGSIKFEIFKSHISGNQIGCSIWLSKEEVIKLKNNQIYFNTLSEDDFFKTYIRIFSFEAMHFEIETLIKKVIPSFIDAIYDYKNAHYKFIQQDDYSTWTNLTNYTVGLG